jgi:Na+-driven multidrug efflux pump
MVVSLLRQWALRLPLGYLFGYLIGWGSVGIYVGMGIANVVCAVILIVIFRTGAWAKAVIATSPEQKAEREADTETLENQP